MGSSPGGGVDVAVSSANTVRQWSQFRAARARPSYPNFLTAFAWHAFSPKTYRAIFLGRSFCEHRSQISIRVRTDTEVPLAAIGAVNPRCKDALCTSRHFTTIIYELLWLSHFGARNHELRDSERRNSAIDRN